MNPRLRARIWPHALLLIPLLLTAAAYWRVLDGEFQFDDTHTVERNLAVKDLRRFLPDRLQTGGLLGGRSVTDLTFALNYAVAGLEPWNYHLTNLVLHLAAVVLVWRLSLLVLRLAGAARAGWVAVSVAGSFALHPLQSQAVSYVSQRAEVLASALYVAALLLLLGAERRGLSLRSAPWLVGGFVTFVLALASKAIAATLPAAWLLVAALVPGQDRPPAWAGWGRRLGVAAPFFAADALVAAGTLRGFEGRADAGFAVPGLPPWTYFVTQLRSIAVYLRLLFWPAGQNVDWNPPAIHSLWEPSALLSGLLLASLVAGAVFLVAWGRRRGGEEGAAARIAGVGVLWFFLLLSVTSSFVPLADVLMEHRPYLASWGILLAVAVGVERSLARAPRWGAVAGAVLVASTWTVLAVTVHLRNAVWETRRSLWSDAVEKAPGNGRAWLALAYAALAEGSVAESVMLNQRALTLAAGQVGLELQILRNLGVGQILLGRVDEAVATFRHAASLRRRDPDILNNLAYALMMKGEIQEAEALARQAIAVAPSKGEAWNTLGEIKLKRSENEEALHLFEKAISLDPDVALRHFNRGVALLRLDQRAQACAIWARIRDRDPGLRRKVAQAWLENCGAGR